MITRKNLSATFDMVTSDQSEIIYDALLRGIYLNIYLSIFNVGATLTVEKVVVYDEIEANETMSNGEIYADADTILNLFQTSESVNPYLIELM